jgi:hypothetical protein
LVTEWITRSASVTYPISAFLTQMKRNSVDLYRRKGIESDPE